VFRNSGWRVLPIALRPAIAELFDVIAIWVIFFLKIWGGLWFCLLAKAFRTHPLGACCLLCMLLGDYSHGLLD
jgi:hypothetical protein